MRGSSRSWVCNHRHKPAACGHSHGRNDMSAMLVVLLGLFAAEDRKDVSLDGEWAVKSVEFNGMKAPEDQIKGNKPVLKGESFKYFKDDKVVMEGTFKADLAKKTLDAEGKDPEGKAVKTIGIMEVKDDTMRVCFVHEGERPKEFSAK